MTEQVLTVQWMQDYIEKHKTEEISLSDLARASLFSPWYAFRLFRNVLGLTPAEYTRKYRLTQAAKQLRGGEVTLYIVYCAVSLLTLSAAALLWGVRLHGSLLAFPRFPWKLGTYYALDPVRRYAGGRRGKGRQAGQRHCFDPLFPHAGLFRHNAADRGHAKGDAKNRQHFPADAGTYDDEEYILRHQHRERLAADWCHGWRCRTLHDPCCSLLPLGMKSFAMDQKRQKPVRS